ncbi:hypothetical protein VTN77DRAFT_5438 [Rasamsonia byssochlamydoides]|uniref:uncharacterized protein n=1 Tax=Rasamsonia byssochlamydoides TaxID=89139 RepID=UPI0037448541
MAHSSTSEERNDPNKHIVKADEVDQTGTDISPVPDDQLMAEVVNGLTRDQAPSTGDSASNAPGGRNPRASGRSELRRDTGAPPPPLQPPPPAPGQQNAELAPDSLSLAQLKKIVQDIPKAEQRAYAFEYADCQPFPEELDEWFQYSEPERMMLLSSKVSFEHHWKEFCEQSSSALGQVSWLDASPELRKSFMERMLDGLHNPDLFSRIEALEAVCYTMAGVWGVTAGRAVDDYPDEPTAKEAAETPKSKSLQIKWIENNVLLVHECSGIPALFEYMRKVFDKDRNLTEPDSIGLENENDHATLIMAREREANLILTCLYFVVEVARRQESFDKAQVVLRDAVAALKPSLLVTLVEIIARLRWDDSASIPFTRIILLFWKSILLLFGGSDSLQAAKAELEPPLKIPDDEASRRTPFLTASPLDYHIFRQEIISKYPAYNPPPPVVPLEMDNNSILPPLPNHPSRLTSVNGLFSGGPSAVSGSGSILHQSVHIATPAPSPPPSPIGPGGKAGKKQNYQTNQNFPFMYPPLDDTSNNIGGKGTSELQDTLVGKKWEGSDVPASIIEAGQLFSSHVKMTRATRQLWEERERFMKYERGWNMDETPRRLDDDVGAGVESGMESSPERSQGKSEPQRVKETDNEDVQRRLDAVEAFYRQAMPHLQSIVIVLLKVILTNVSAMVNQANGQNGHGPSAVNGYTSGPNGVSANHGSDVDIEELDMTRLREITGKAVSGSLLLLLKWFKRSHILKFEYMTQLLLDSNYLPLILKMFAHQDVDQAVAQKNDREDLSFFHFCHVNSDHPPEPPTSPGESSHSEDEAVPPPILRQNRPQGFITGSGSVRGPSPEKFSESVAEFSEGPIRPEVDELGYPTGPLPKEPITTYSFRNFFSAINFLHIMQKITRDKAHRCLLLVQYKSSTILRKGLKIPDPHLRLYTLKLFKSQVPYCGRKWRQSNMRVITAIYLYCRPELRDDWLAGSDVDAEVEEALPLEQALRGLTHWWHLRQYKDVMNIEEGASRIEEERDFFTRELEAMGWGLYGDDTLNEVGDDREMGGPGGPPNGTEWDGGPLQMEGW